jgi:hypothetical protein
LIFTVGIFVISEVLSESIQVLNGDGFNTIAQFGQSIHLNGVDIVSNSHDQFNSSPEALLIGYQTARF